MSYCSTHLAVCNTENGQCVVRLLWNLFNCNREAPKTLCVSFSFWQIIHKFGLVKLSTKNDYFTYKGNTIKMMNYCDPTNHITQLGFNFSFRVTRVVFNLNLPVSLFLLRSPWQQGATLVPRPCAKNLLRFRTRDAEWRCSAVDLCDPIRLSDGHTFSTWRRHVTRACFWFNFWKAKCKQRRPFLRSFWALLHLIYVQQKD